MGGANFHALVCQRQPAWAIGTKMGGSRHACGNPKSSPTRTPCVYIHADKPKGTRYIGATSNLFRQNWQHKELDSLSHRERVRVRGYPRSSHSLRPSLGSRNPRETSRTAWCRRLTLKNTAGPWTPRATNQWIGCPSPGWRVILRVVFLSHHLPNGVSGHLVAVATTR